MEKKHYIVDAKNKSLGRLASEIATLLLGKREPEYQFEKDPKVFVTVKNLEKIRLFQKKAQKKKYFFHSEYVGHWKEISLADLWKKDPERVLKMVVYGMLRKNRLRKKIIKRLKVEKS